MGAPHWTSVLRGHDRNAFFFKFFGPLVLSSPSGTPWELARELLRSAGRARALVSFEGKLPVPAAPAGPGWWRWCHTRFWGRFWGPRFELSLVFKRSFWGRVYVVWNRFRSSCLCCIAPQVWSSVTSFGTVFGARASVALVRKACSKRRLEPLSELVPLLLWSARRGGALVRIRRIQPIGADRGASFSRIFIT